MSTMKGQCMPLIQKFLRDDSGQGLVEYALIIALVSIAALIALKALGSKANNTLSNAASSLK